MSKCEFDSCKNEAHTGTRLCDEHLDLIDYDDKQVGQSSKDDQPDELDNRLEEFANTIARSQQMMKLTETIMNTGILDQAIQSFSSLSSLSEEAMHDLSTYISVNIVSAIIQEKANTLLRASMFAEVFPNETGLQEFIASEFEFLNDNATRQ